jgi:hypothetical protein
MGPSAGVAGRRKPGAVPGGDVAHRFDDDGGIPLYGRARGDVGASRAKGTGGAADCRGGSVGDLGAGCHSSDGGEKQPSSCRICLFLASTAARLLAQVTLLKVFAHFLGGGAGCGDTVGGGYTVDCGAGNGAAASGNAGSGDAGGGDAGGGDAGGGDATNAAEVERCCRHQPGVLPCQPLHTPTRTSP